MLANLKRRGKDTNAKLFVSSSVKVICCLFTANLDIALPTSFEKSSIRFDGYDLTFYDVGGDVSMRNQWKSYYAEVRIAN